MILFCKPNKGVLFIRGTSVSPPPPTQQPSWGGGGGYHDRREPQERFKDDDDLIEIIEIILSAGVL